MYLGIRVQIPNTLNIYDHYFVTGTFKGKVAESLRRLTMSIVAEDETRIRVVLDVGPFDEILYMIEGLVGPVDKLQDGHLKKIYLLRWVVSIVLLTPQFGIHLKFDFVKIDLAINRLHEAFGNCVVRVPTPILL